MAKSKPAVTAKQERLAFGNDLEPSAPKRPKRAKGISARERKERLERWSRFLSAKRLGGESAADARTTFERDYDRLIFSSHFRRLADKTQVFPLSNTDYTRTRLTHSLEAASIARSLGSNAGRALAKAELLPTGVAPEQIGTLIATAALAHDIGNPPFGHAGEEAVRRWARQFLSDGQGLSNREAADLLNFEGNAQGFRILTRLFAPYRVAGMRPSLALCGTASKYTCAADKMSNALPWTKKNGHYVDDETLAAESFDALGLSGAGSARRHPLAFLTEAADDIAYHVIDLEDTYKLKAISFEDTHLLLSAIAAKLPTFQDDPSAPEDAQIERLRAAAVTVLINACGQVFLDNLERIERGEFASSLLKKCEHFDAADALVKKARTCGYDHPRVLQIEVAGFIALEGFARAFCRCRNSRQARCGTENSTQTSSIAIPVEARSRRHKGETDAVRRAVGVSSPSCSHRLRLGNDRFVRSRPVPKALGYPTACVAGCTARVLTVARWPSGLQRKQALYGTSLTLRIKRHMSRTCGSSRLAITVA